MDRWFELQDIQELMDIETSNSPRVYSLRKNYFEDLDDAEFVKRFRLSKETCRLLETQISGAITSNTTRNRALSAETKLLVTLRFYASGSFLVTVGDFCGFSVSAASRAVKQVSYAIASLASTYIKFGNIEETVNDFYQIAKFPRVIGAIDCAHIRIQSPGGANAEIFRNRKGYFSFNVQAVFNAKLLFEDIVARWPGSSHDSNIFNNSRLKFRFDSGEFNNFLLLGDSGYKLSKYMLTPLLNAATRCDQLYNESQIRTRNVIERCFGVWKRRFPVLSVGIRLCVDTTKEVIIACAVLHNIAVLQKDPVPQVENFNLPPEMFSTDTTQNVETHNFNDARTRNNLIANYFSTL